MSDVFIKNQVPKRGSSGNLQGSSDFAPDTGITSDSNVLTVGDIVMTTLGRGQVTAVSGARAQITLEHYNTVVEVQASGANGTTI